MKEKNIEVSHKFYLRIRVYYKLLSDDIDSVNFFYMQNTYEIKRNRLPLEIKEIIKLVAR